MKVKVDVEGEEKEIDTEARTVEELLKELDVNPVSHIVSLNGELAVEEDEINAEDELKVQTVVSGG